MRKARKGLKRGSDSPNTYLCIHIYACIRMYVCTNTCICIYMMKVNRKGKASKEGPIQLNIYSRTHACMCTCMDVYMYVYVRMLVHMHIYACAYMYDVRMYTCMYIVIKDGKRSKGHKMATRTCMQICIGVYVQNAVDIASIYVCVRARDTSAVIHMSVYGSDVFTVHVCMLVLMLCDVEVGESCACVHMYTCVYACDVCVQTDIMMYARATFLRVS